MIRDLFAPWLWLNFSTIALLSASNLVATGCGPTLAPAQPDAKIRLTQLLRLYTVYSDKHRKGPPNEQALKEFGQKMTPQEREAALLTEDVENIFTSSRDNQKFEVRYNLRIDPGNNRAVAWETIGKDGKRFVALTMGYVEEYDEQTLADYKKR
jgi:hypothetical protein